MKRVLITGGPTNEYIDEVMKITNMSSGKLATELAMHFTGALYEVTLLLTKGIKFDFSSPHLRVVRFETTEQLLRCIEEEAKNSHYDIIIHSAAVADYKPQFSFRAEDMAEEIAKIFTQGDVVKTGSFHDIKTAVFDVLTNPKCKVDDNTKISSVEPNLTVKLGLTPKIIASLRDYFPNAYICGFKLLEGVDEDELVDAAKKQIIKCNTNLVFANDLAELRKGNAFRLVVSRSGYNNIKVDGAYGIFNLIRMMNP